MPEHIDFAGHRDLHHELFTAVDDLGEAELAADEAIVDFGQGAFRRPVDEHFRADVKAMAERTEAEIKSGKTLVFAGPITRQDGTVAVKAGEVMPDKDILGLNWYVKGVDDKVPQ